MLLQVAAGVEHVAGADRRRDVGRRELVLQQPLRVEVDAPGGLAAAQHVHARHAGQRAQPLGEVVLRPAAQGHRIAAGQHVGREHGERGADVLELRPGARRQRGGGLGQAGVDQLPGLQHVHPPGELDRHLREARCRDGAHALQVAEPEHRVLDRPGDQLLDVLGRAGRVVGDDVDQRVVEVGEEVDRQLAEAREAGDEDDQHAGGDGEGIAEEALEHRLSPRT